MVHLGIPKAYFVVALYTQVSFKLMKWFQIHQTAQLITDLMISYF